MKIHKIIADSGIYHRLLFDNSSREDVFDQFEGNRLGLSIYFERYQTIESIYYSITATFRHPTKIN